MAVRELPASAEGDGGRAVLSLPDAAALAEAGVSAVLVPGASYSLRSPQAPGPSLWDAGCTAALATDCNPGTSPVLSMPEAVALGCALYGLSPAHALTAATINAAWVLGLHRRLGSLEAGKRADFVVLDAPEFRAVPYRPGHNPVAAVYVGGVRVDHPTPAAG